MAFFQRGTDTFHRTGYKDCILFVQATQESLRCGVVRPTAVEDDHETLRLADGDRTDTARTRGVVLELAGHSDQNQLRTWAETGAKISCILISGGKGRNYQFYEEVTARANVVDAPHGNLGTDRVELSTRKYLAEIYANQSLIDHLPMETSWTEDTTHTGTGFDGTDGIYTIVTETGSNTATLYTDLILPYTGGTVYFAADFSSLSGAGASREIGIIALEAGEIGVALGAETNSATTTSVTTTDRYEVTAALPDDTWGVRVYVSQTSDAADASMGVTAPSLTAKSTAADDTVAVPLPTFGITGAMDSGDTELTVDDIRATLTDLGGGIYRLVYPDSAFVEYPAGYDGIIIRLRTDNDWTQSS